MGGHRESYEGMNMVTTQSTHDSRVDWTPLPVPWAVQAVDRIPKQRYYDPEFYALETEMLWPRVWQMACRLEEIPRPGDYVEYEILDESVIVVRLDAENVRAYHNACRHRGVKLVEGNGNRRTFVCPFHGWCWGIDGRNTFVLRPEEFDDHNLDPEDLRLVSVRCEVWGGCAWINLDDDAPPFRDCLEPFASIYDAWKVESLRVEWWQSCRLPVNWKLATAAFMEGYHVPQTHPQLLPSSMPKQPAKPPGPAQTNLYFMRTLGEGMAGMTHENDVRIAEGLQDMDLPADPAEAMAVWRSTLNDAIVHWHRARGCDVPDLNELQRRGITEAINFAFPHYFLLPQYSSASSYRIRRWVRRRRCSRSGRSPASRRSRARPSRRRRSRWRPTTRAGHPYRLRTSPTCRGNRKACIPEGLTTCGCPAGSRA